MRTVLAALCALVLLAGCSSGATVTGGMQPWSASPAASSQGAHADYGQAVTIKTTTGSVSYTVGKPVLVTYHDADCCDDNNPNGAKKGKVQGSVIRFEIHASGITGTVDVASDFQAQYETSSGTLVDEALPLMTYENTSDALSSQPTRLGPGQSTSGALWMNTQDVAGSFVLTAESETTPAATWS